MSTLSTKPCALANPTYTPQTYSTTGYNTFRSFYPYYLGEHSNAVCLVGTSLSLLTFLRASLAALPLLFALRNKRLEELLRFGSEGWRSVGRLVLGGLVQGYAWAWVGHFFYERNKPATFKHPFYSFLGDLTLWKEVVTGKRRP
ncbi:hypothetical protein JCM8097_004343 [Rhodosporidiobolus ruineniae]